MIKMLVDFKFKTFKLIANYSNDVFGSPAKDWKFIVSCTNLPLLQFLILEDIFIWLFLFEIIIKLRRIFTLWKT